jgi:uncharacterized LabA/DUF88 family protein
MYANMVIVIIDFDNYFRDIKSIDDSQRFELALSEIIDKCEEHFESIDKISIRLYGGWYQETSLTKQASIIQQLLSQISVFPKVKNNKITNGTVEMVSSLFEIPNVKWHYTYKEKNGIGRVRINHELVDDFCTMNKEQCPKYILYKFTAKKDKQCHISNCTHIHKDVFKGIEQKMVDTMIACDVISATKSENINGIFVLSDDQDHFPSYALASELVKQKGESVFPIILGITNNDEERNKLISTLLTPFDNIKIILMI